VSEIRSQDKVINNFDDIKTEASKYFEDLYTDQPVIEDAQLLNLVPNAIKSKDNDALKQVVTLEEIKQVVDNMEDDRAPGPDGFNVNFIKICWEIVKIDLLKMVMKSQRCIKIGGSTNSAFLALIPKEKGAKTFDRFRPISLCNIGYKIITKIMANRLKNILPQLIPENQGGFVKGRMIWDNIILVQEAIHSSQKNGDKGMAVKLDLANAFDRVSHSFLYQVMRRFGFAPEFISWVKACISQPWIAPLINGRAGPFFKASRGLRQGCPLSPLLYAIQASVLSLQLEYARQDQELSGIRMARGTKDINHALFADDTILLGGASRIIARRFKLEMNRYCNASGSKINLGKS